MAAISSLRASGAERRADFLHELNSGVVRALRARRIGPRLRRSAALRGMGFFDTLLGGFPLLKALAASAGKAQEKKAGRRTSLLARPPDGVAKDQEAGGEPQAVFLSHGRSHLRENERLIDIGRGRLLIQDPAVILSDIKDCG